ncbi:hypothetical protein ID856_14390 [Xenorhabdus sp. 18]|uniref:hypothetical protein n=1 Tax=Xenorhabdus doucetiae TaxID=351671 RepID=UPI0019AE46F6|nr:hypothetical protein [Xenorhabdus sp. 18]MBD2797714.1 hypothetical protein [Xenorhabdus sp. 18]
MTEINFEALGRCEHLKDKILNAIADRNSASRLLKHGFSESSEYGISRIQHIDITKLREAIDALEKADIELMALVDEYNKYAAQAGKKDIIVVKR